MDPFSSLGVASNVVQLIDLAAKLVSGTYKIHRASSEEKGYTRDIRFITDKLQKLNKDLGDSISRSVSLASASNLDKDIIKLCAECEEVAKQLLSVLTKLDAKTGQGVWSSARQALLTLLNQDQHHLISSQHQHSQEKKETESVLEDIRKLSNTLLEHVNQNNRLQQDIIKAVNKNCLSQTTDVAKIHSKGDSLVQLLTDSDKTLLNDRTLSLLQYTEIQRRSEAICDAYKNTFEWIFEDQTPDASWNSFVQWLQSNDNLYWITGKPGAGKSTLMKFLFEDKRVRPLLKIWAGKKDLIVTAFYFWNSGTQIQMSLEGLTRTLLYSVLQQRPELIPQVFPHQLEAWILFGDDTQHFAGNRGIQDDLLSWQELLAALQRLGHVLRAEDSARVVFFLDGLDEFGGEPAHLIAFIQALVSPNVKICVSSRPWIVFEDAFRLLPSLRMEVLTRRDIKIYVESKFGGNSGFQARRILEPAYADEIVENVVDKASGVFFVGFVGGERLSELQQRLDALPSDIEKLFWNILDALDTFHFERASQLFQIIRASTVPLSVLGLSFADDDDLQALYRLENKPLSAQEGAARAEIMRRRLNVCCKGMIEPNSKSENSLASEPVGYLHRTVKDFLQKPENWNKLLRATNRSFDPRLRLSFAHAMLLKVLDVHKCAADQLIDHVARIIQHSMAVHSDGSETQFRLFNEVDKTVKRKVRDISHYRGPVLHRDLVYDKQSRTDWINIQRYIEQDDTFLECAVHLQLFAFVQESFNQSAASTFNRKQIDTTRLLYHAAKSYCEQARCIDGIITWKTRHVDMVRLLFECGANPNAKFNGSTPWQVVVRNYPRHEVSETEREQDAELLSLFLRHGAATDAVDMCRLPMDIIIRKTSTHRQEALEVPAIQEMKPECISWTKALLYLLKVFFERKRSH
ncbi:hypothetical protein H2200_006707 [Cladophialophora chaetospira]|uniref:NACHT domain-containing protein n=1 Tax=Cladophialophora chaetospira TaxID=386627 RepID=A0AA39CI66_9EURO|nr:hypothetical protein H2200_006707 [Cladophialophora chaetospira]